MVQHVRSKALQMKQKIDYKRVILLMIRASVVMVLFGITWLFAILTVSVPGLRETFQILFTFFNSFQGVFIFIFFCVLSQEARKSWRQVLFKIYLKISPTQVSKFSHHKHPDRKSTTSTKMSSVPSKFELSIIFN